MNHVYLAQARLAAPSFPPMRIRQTFRGPGVPYPLGGDVASEIVEVMVAGVRNGGAGDGRGQ